MGEKSSSSQPRAPALNKFMHPRNPYRTPPSFKQIATLYPEFRKFCSYDLDGKVRLDFSQPRGLGELAIALMHKDFGLTVSLPNSHLVPTIPLRLNYLLWLQDLVGLWAPRLKRNNQQKPFSLTEALLLQQEQKEQFQQQRDGKVKDLIPLKADCELQSEKVENKRLESTQYLNPVIGLDIGCGASCVYGLLGARHCGWHMLATDTDAVSLGHAASNVRNNNMQDKVHLVQGEAECLFGVLDTAATQQYLAGVRDGHSDEGQEPMDTDSSFPCDGAGYMLDFSMCNPPFFSSEQDADSTSKTKKQRGPPSNGYTGTVSETVYEGGGEVAFISMMIQESIKYKHKIRLFSTLVGSSGDVKRVKKILQASQPSSYTVTEFCQGRTMRWGVAWTWCCDLSLQSVVSAKQTSAAKPLVLKWPRQSCLPVYTVSAAWEALQLWLQQIKLKPKVFKSSKYFVGASLKAYRETWKNQRQLRREELRKQAEADDKCVQSSACSSPCSSTSEAMSLASVVSSPSSKRQLDGDVTNGVTDDIQMPETKKVRLATEGDTSDEELDTDSEENGDCNDKNYGPNGMESNLKESQPVVIDKKPKKATGKPCLLKINIFVKLVDNQLMIEFHVLGGLLGRDAANQLITFVRNKLLKK